MRRLSWFIVFAGLAACQPAEPKTAPSAPPSAVPSAPSDDAPNANAARYGPHGVAVTPSPVNDIPPSKPEGETAPGGGAGPLPSGAPGSQPGSDEATAEMRGHPCQCGKTCHCGHCSGAVPGCHCHVKRADGKETE